MKRSFPPASPLLAVCGLYCGACYHYRASSPEGKHLIEKAVCQGRNPEGFTCQGCRSEYLYIHPGCAECQIRNCAEARGLIHCGQCGAFPCERLLAFKNDGHIHHLDIFAQLEQLNQMGPEHWLNQQAKRWTCACGVPYSWYEDQCSACGAALRPYTSSETGTT